MREIIINSKLINIDSGIFFGRGIFETILLKDKPIFLEEHIKRLNDGIRILNIGEEVKFSYIKKIILENGFNNCVLKILITEKNLLITTRDIPYKEEDYQKGFKLKVTDVRRNSTSRLTYIKSINYIENLIEKQQAKEEGFEEVLFLNEKDYVAEGATSNIFGVKDGKIYTPSLKTGLLNGIIRNFVINNFKVYEKNITLEELLNFDEVFITNSLLGIMNVKKIKNKSYDQKKVVEIIEKRYKDLIGY